MQEQDLVNARRKGGGSLSGSGMDTLGEERREGAEGGRGRPRAVDMGQEEGRLRRRMKVIRDEGEDGGG